MATAPAKQVYRRRSTIVEPVFGLLKEWHGARRFLLRGRSQVASEWHLLATAFNLKSLHAKSLHALWRSGLSPAPPRGRVCHLHRLVHTIRHLTVSLTQFILPRTKIMRQPPGERAGGEGKWQAPTDERRARPVRDTGLQTYATGDVRRGVHCHFV